METDSDSLYTAFARETMKECVKPELKEQWKQEKSKNFTLEDHFINILECVRCIMRWSLTTLQTIRNMLKLSKFYMIT